MPRKTMSDTILNGLVSRYHRMGDVKIGRNLAKKYSVAMTGDRFCPACNLEAAESAYSTPVRKYSVAASRIQRPDRKVRDNSDLDASLREH